MPDCVRAGAESPQAPPEEDTPMTGMEEALPAPSPDFELPEREARPSSPHPCRGKASASEGEISECAGKI